MNEAPRGLRHLTLGDRGDWDRVRALLRDAAGESTSEIWLDQLELTAVAGHGTLVLGVNQETASWVRERFRRLLFGRRVKRVRREF